MRDSRSPRFHYRGNSTMRYDFQCQEPDCGEIFEVTRKMGDDSPATCPTCRSTNTHKIILASPAIHMYWKNSAGMNSRGFLILGPAKNTKLRKEEDDESGLYPKQGRAHTDRQ